MEFEDIETIYDISVFSNGNMISQNSINLSAEIFNNTNLEIDFYYFDFWDTQMQIKGRNQLPSSNSPYLTYFQIKKNGEKTYSAGFAFALDFENIVSKVEANGSNTTFYFYPTAKVYVYNRKHRKYTVKNINSLDLTEMPNFNTDGNPSALMDSQSPDHPKTYIAGGIWG